MRRLVTALILVLIYRPVFAQDAIDLRQAVVHNSPADVADWPATTAITRLEMSTPAGLAFTFPAQQTWPNYTPPGWTGPLQYTVWACTKMENWHCAGFIQMWRGRPSTGAPILSDFNANWAYDAARWGPMASYRPHPGEVLAFFVTAGNARGETAATSVRERSNVVLVALPADDTGVFTFGVAPQPTPIVIPPPAPPTPSPQSPVVSNPAPDDARVLAAIADLKATMQAEHAEQTRTIGEALKSFGEFALKYLAPAIGGWLVAHK